MLETNEDKIKEIYESIVEVESYCNILYCASGNENEVPEWDDIKNSLYILLEYIEKLKEKTSDYINHCEESGIFKSSGNDISKPWAIFSKVVTFAVVSAFSILITVEGSKPFK